MLNQSVRAGHFTSSQIWRLMTKGRGNQISKVALTYIADVAMEKRLGRVLNANHSSRPTSWGKAIEPRVAAMLDMLTWKYQSEETITHPTIANWCGTPDVVSKDCVGDIKCPYTLKAFGQLADICGLADKELLKKEFPEYFWQLVSNAILTGKSKAQIIVYCPYKSELDDIVKSLENLDDHELQTESQWIAFSSEDMLPWIPDGGYYKNLNQFQFEVTEDDKTALETAVEVANGQLEMARLYSY